MLASCILVHVIHRYYQGSQRPGKSWKTWKMKNAFSRPGKIMEFEKKDKIMDHGKMMLESWKIMEKSWNLIPGKRWEPCLGRLLSESYS